MNQTLPHQNAQAATQTTTQATAQAIVEHVAQKLLGKDEHILLALTCLIAGGHVLLEDVPGLGKTTLAKSLAASIGCEFKRIQCTPDMMPSDITVSYTHLTLPTIYSV